MFGAPCEQFQGSKALYQLEVTEETDYTFKLQTGY